MKKLIGKAVLCAGVAVFLTVAPATAWIEYQEVPVYDPIGARWPTKITITYSTPNGDTITDISISC